MIEQNKFSSKESPHEYKKELSTDSLADASASNTSSLSSRSSSQNDSEKSFKISSENNFTLSTHTLHNENKQKIYQQIIAKINQDKTEALKKHSVFLDQKKFQQIDVKGDGSCGFYALKVAMFHAAKDEPNKLVNAFSHMESRKEYFTNQMTNTMSILNKLRNNKTADLQTTIRQLSLQEKKTLSVTLAFMKSFLDYDPTTNNPASNQSLDKLHHYLLENVHIFSSGTLIDKMQFMLQLPKSYWKTMQAKLSNPNFFLNKYTLEAIAFDKGFHMDLFNFRGSSLKPETGYNADTLNDYKKLFETYSTDQELEILKNETKNQIILSRHNGNHFRALIPESLLK